MARRKALPRNQNYTPLTLTGKSGMLIVHRNYIVITGDAGSAALALAQHVFSKPKVQSLYMMCLTITHINGKYGLEIFSSTLPEKWEEFKATFEKVCNNLAVFM